MSPEMLRFHHSVKKTMRHFFDQQGFTEVQTPVLNRYWTTEPYIEPVRGGISYPDGNHITAFLSPSPEFGLKRLISPEVPNVYELAPCFRNLEDPRDGKHGFEFTMLEFYSRGADINQILNLSLELIDYLIGYILKQPDLTPVLRHHFINDINNPNNSEIQRNTKNNISKPSKPYHMPVKILTIKEAFLKFAGIDFNALKSWNDLGNFIKKKQEKGLNNPDDFFWYLMLEKIEPAMKSYPVSVLKDFPDFQGGFTKTFQSGSLNYAHRFEIFTYGTELANGGEEITDGAVLKNVFSSNRKKSISLKKTPYPEDPGFAEAIDTDRRISGTAFGLERLFMFLSGKDKISDVRLSYF